MRFENYCEQWHRDFIKNCINISCDKYNPEKESLNCLCIEMENISQGTGQLLSTNNIKLQKSIKNKFSKNDVLFGKLRPYLKKYYNPNFSGVCSSEFWVLNSKLLDKGFLYYFIQTPTFLNSANLSCGSKMPRADWNVISKQFCHYPSDQEQQKIANFFDLIDQRIQTQSKIIEDLECFKDDIMDHILNHFKFQTLSIKQLANLHYIKIIKASELPKFTGTRQYLSTSSIDKNGVKEIESIISFNDRPSRATMYPIKDSVWFAKMKNTIKVFHSINDDQNKYILSSGFYGIVCDNKYLSSYWAEEMFKSKYFNMQKDKFSEGGTMSGIKDNQLTDINIKIFINKREELISVNLLKNLTVKIQIEKDILNAYKKQKAYLLQNMFI